MGNTGDKKQETYDLLGELRRERQSAKAADASAAGYTARSARDSTGSSARTDKKTSGSARADSARKRAPRNTSGVRMSSVSRSSASSYRAARRRPPSWADRIKIIAIAVIALVLAIFLIVTVAKALGGLIFRTVNESMEESIAESEAAESIAVEESLMAVEAERGSIFDEARLLAAQYDYDGAIEKLTSMAGYEEDAEAMDLVDEYEEIKSTLVEQEVLTIPHIFFHILSVDPETSFDKSKWGTQADGYNSLMTTVDEFRAMLHQLYEGGYVLVALHDLAHEETGEDGSVRMVKGSILLPPGKKAIVMSEDDVCYYEYMKGAGFADLMLVGDDGRPINRYTDSSGTEHYGAYDVATILDEFLDEYPDFSYHGHKACLVFTGYNGVLGYRTDESYDPTSEYYDSSLEQGHDVAAEREEAVKVLRALYEDGYELGSHSWGHRDLGTIEWDRFKKDCDRWERNVASLIREATGSQPDIIIYPRGADVGDWHPYSSDNERFNYLYQLGFRYYCNVDNNQYWVQVSDTYLRQGRRALDGYNLWMDISGQKDRLGDLFTDLDAIFDPTRPTPVPSY